MTFADALSRVFIDGVFPASLLGFAGYELSRGYQDYWKPYFKMNHIKMIVIALLVYALVIAFICALVAVATGANWLHGLVFGFTFPSSAAEMQRRLTKMSRVNMGSGTPGVETTSAEDTRIREVPVWYRLRKALSQAVVLPAVAPSR
jgi:hypothetical protein